MTLHVLYSVARSPVVLDCSCPPAFAFAYAYAYAFALAFVFAFAFALMVLWVSVWLAVLTNDKRRVTFKGLRERGGKGGFEGTLVSHIVHRILSLKGSITLTTIPTTPTSSLDQGDYTVHLTPDPKYGLGLRLEEGAKGQILATSFKRVPDTNRKLPAELSGAGEERLPASIHRPPLVVLPPLPTISLT